MRPASVPRAVPAPAAKPRSLLRDMYKHRAYYLVILPAIMCFVIVKYIPIGGIVLAFKNFTITGGIWGSEWAGLKYFERMLQSADFFRVFRNTIVISLLKLATVFPAPIVFALMLNEVFSLRLKKTFQTISYLPHFISWVVAAGLFRSFLSFEGPLNYLLLLDGGGNVGGLENRGMGLDHLSGRHRRHRSGALRYRPD